MTFGILALMGSVPAKGNLILDGSFEDAQGTGQVNAPNTTFIPNWRVQANSVDVVSFWQAADGTKSIDLTGTSLGQLEQDFATTPSSIYEVRFAMAANANGTPLGVYSLSLSVTGAAPQQFNFNRTAAHTISNMGYVEQAWQFTATSAITTLAFSSLTNNVNGGPVIDDVRVELVPEPATGLLICAAGLLIARRRRA